MLCLKKSFQLFSSLRYVYLHKEEGGVIANIRSVCDKASQQIVFIQSIYTYLLHVHIEFEFTLFIRAN